MENLIKRTEIDSWNEHYQVENNGIDACFFTFRAFLSPIMIVEMKKNCTFAFANTVKQIALKPKLK